RSGDGVLLSGARNLFGDDKSGAAERTARLQDAHVGAVETAGRPEESGVLAGAGRTLAIGGRVARIALPRKGGGEGDGGIGGEKGNLSEAIRTAGKCSVSLELWETIFLPRIASKEKQCKSANLEIATWKFRL